MRACLILLYKNFAVGEYNYIKPMRYACQTRNSQQIRKLTRLYDYSSDMDTFIDSISWMYNNKLYDEIYYFISTRPDADLTHNNCALLKMIFANLRVDSYTKIKLASWLKSQESQLCPSANNDDIFSYLCLKSDPDSAKFITSLYNGKSISDYNNLVAICMMHNRYEYLPLIDAHFTDCFNDSTKN